MKNIYVQNEAKKNFKDWSKQGLEFLLNIDDVNNGDEVKKEIYTIASKYHIVDTTVEFR